MLIGFGIELLKFMLPMVNNGNKMFDANDQCNKNPCKNLYNFSILQLSRLPYIVYTYLPYYDLSLVKNVRGNNQISAPKLEIH